MSPRRDYERIAALAFLSIAVPVGIGLTIYWAVLSNFPRVTVGGWLLAVGYMSSVWMVPTVLAPYVSRRFDMGPATWRVIAYVWVTATAIAGLLAWPALGPYIGPFFVGGSSNR